MSSVCYVYCSLCLVFVMSSVCYFQLLLCLVFVMSSVCYVQCLLCPPFVMSALCYVCPLLCPPFVMSAVCYVRHLLCPLFVMSTVCYVHRLLCPPFVMSAVCYVCPLLCLVFVMSAVCYVPCLSIQGLSCLVFVCPGFDVLPNFHVSRTVLQVRHFKRKEHHLYLKTLPIIIQSYCFPLCASFKLPFFKILVGKFSKKEPLIWCFLRKMGSAQAP